MPWVLGQMLYSLQAFIAIPVASSLFEIIRFFVRGKDFPGTPGRTGQGFPCPKVIFTGLSGSQCPFGKKFEQKILRVAAKKILLLHSASFKKVPPPLSVRVGLNLS
jgi:hypothetical protein